MSWVGVVEKWGTFVGFARFGYYLVLVNGFVVRVESGRGWVVFLFLEEKSECGVYFRGFFFFKYVIIGEDRILRDIG